MAVFRINDHEAEYGADGFRAFRDEEAIQAASIRELHEQYKPIVLEAVIQDTRYRNACGHSNYENAVIEGNAAIRRAVLGSGNMGLLRLYSDTPEFRQRLHREVIDETYPKLHELLHPLSDNDIDRAIQEWNGKIESKHAVVRYMKDHELTLTEEVEIRYRTETSTDPVTGETTTEEVPYEYYILNVKLTSKPISSVASELLTPDQLEMYQVYRQTLGNKPLIFGGGSPDMSNSEDLTGVVFVNGTRPGNQAVVDIAKSQVGNVGGQPYWSWYGFSSRVEWCACFVSWCYGQMGLSEPRFAACQSQGVPWFQSHGQWGGRDYANIAPGDAIFFDWDLDGSADHVGLVVGTDGSRVYTVEGNSGDACKIKSYSLTYECIKGYGLMNW